jgi:hypothetical protein
MALSAFLSPPRRAALRPQISPPPVAEEMEKVSAEERKKDPAFAAVCPVASVPANVRSNLPLAEVAPPAGPPDNGGPAEPIHSQR